jgi:hypothetical protein
MANVVGEEIGDHEVLLFKPSNSLWAGQTPSTGDWYQGVQDL